MSKKGAEPTLIIRRKKVIQGGHHGGAWKVAYADFVTAMMAFFLLMWLLNATSEEQRKGIADYFSPTVPVFPTRGGGDGPFGGSSMFSDDSLAEVEPGSQPGNPMEESIVALTDPSLGEIESELLGESGDAMAANPAMEHIRTRLTDDGLIIEVFDIEGSPLFIGGTAVPTPTVEALLGMIGRVLSHTVNPIAVAGHVGPGATDVWRLSVDRAQVARQLIVEAGVGDGRIARVTGNADRNPATDDPTDWRNRRIEITVLRRFDP